MINRKGGSDEHRTVHHQVSTRPQNRIWRLPISGRRIKIEWYLRALINKFVCYVFGTRSVHRFQVLFGTTGTSTIIKIHPRRRIITHVFQEGSDRCGVSVVVIECQTLVCQISRKRIQNDKHSSNHYLMKHVQCMVLVSELQAAAAVQIVFRMNHLQKFIKGIFVFSSTR